MTIEAPSGRKKNKTKCKISLKYMQEIRGWTMVHEVSVPGQ